MASQSATSCWEIQSILSWTGSWKATPIPQNITPEQESFNAYLSSARTTVEIAFGRLKSRWRVLMKLGVFHFSFTPKVIATCCALHNFCLWEWEGSCESQLVSGSGYTCIEPATARWPCQQSRRQYKWTEDQSRPHRLPECKLPPAQTIPLDVLVFNT